MNYVDALRTRRSVYQLNKEISMTDQQLTELIETVTELTPDSFNMKSARVVTVLGKKHEELWDKIYDIYEGKVPREKIDGFRNGYGTILYFIDTDVVKSYQKQVAKYVENFPVWTNQANGMLQYNIWTALSAKKMGACLLHYNPVIDEEIRQIYQLPESFQLIAQMPFGGIAKEAKVKDTENIKDRVRVIK